MAGPLSECPAWCTSDHEKADPGTVHAYVHIAAESSTPIPSGVTVKSCAWWSGYAHRPPEVYVNFAAAPGSDQLSLDAKTAYGLAALLELLKGSTPDQRGQLAAHLREAAGAITNGGAS